MRDKLADEVYEFGPVNNRKLLVTTCNYAMPYNDYTCKVFPIPRTRSFRSKTLRLWFTMFLYPSEWFHALMFLLPSNLRIKPPSLTPLNSTKVGWRWKYTRCNKILLCLIMPWNLCFRKYAELIKHVLLSIICFGLEIN